MNSLFWAILHCKGPGLIDAPNVFVNFVVISSLECLISKEIDLVVSFKEAKTVSFVPSIGESIKRNLTSNWIGQPDIWESLVNCCNKLLSYFVFMIIFLKITSLFLGTISSDWTNIQHSCPVLNKCSSFDRNIKIRKISQDKIKELFQFLFS